METKILDIHQETPTVVSVRFEKPANFIFLPGQFINLTLSIDNCDQRCNRRNFSLTSSPNDKFLMIATRTGQSRFKDTLEYIQVGTNVMISPPLGKFILNEDENLPAIMLSGGIGITPLHSMIKYATEEKLKKKITLIYSNSSAGDIPFKKDLDDLDQINEYLIIHHAITDDPTWTGLNRRIDEAMIKELAPNWQVSEFYICGPAKMVLSIKEILKKMNIIYEKIKSELFTGY